jgi:outer membrane protein
MRTSAFSCIGLTVWLGASLAHADTVGVDVSADYWQYDGVADVAQTGKTKSEFRFDQQQQLSLAVSLEHPVPVLPNVRLRYTALQGNNTRSVGVLEFGGHTYLAKDVNLDVDLTSTDLVLYYEVLDNLVSVDVGLAAKWVQGKVVAQEQSGLQKHEVSLNDVLPMVYLSAGGKLPLTGLSVKAEVAGVSYQGNRLTDAQAEIQYNFMDNAAVDAGLKLGYRQMSATLENVENTDADLDFKGPYLGLALHF